MAFGGSAVPFTTTLTASAWYYQCTSCASSAKTVPGLEVNNAAQVTVALLHNTNTLQYFLVAVYNTDANTVSAGTASVTVTATTPTLGMEVADDPNDNPSAPTSGAQSMSLSYTWAINKTDGFVIKVGAGTEVCMDHTSLTGTTKMRYAYGGGTYVQLATTAAAILNNNLCVRVPT